LSISSTAFPTRLRRPHLQSYLDECAFHFNRGKSRHAAFHALHDIALGAKTLTYKILIAPEARHKPSN